MPSVSLKHIIQSPRLIFSTLPVWCQALALCSAFAVGPATEVPGAGRSSTGGSMPTVVHPPGSLTVVHPPGSSTVVHPPASSTSVQPPGSSSSPSPKAFCWLGACPGRGVLSVPCATQSKEAITSQWYTGKRKNTAAHSLRILALHVRLGPNNHTLGGTPCSLCKSLSHISRHTEQLRESEPVGLAGLP